MYKLSHRVAEAWVEHSFAPTFSRMPTTSGGQVLLVGVPAGDNMVMMKLLECVEAPFFLLYVLHSPRGEAEPGRYQSPKLSLAEVHAFIMRFSPLLSNDARQDFWVYSIESEATIVWEQHNLIYAYGPLDCFESSLRATGFADGQPLVPDPHGHHFHEEYDGLASELMAAFEWRQSPLEESDYQ